MICVVVVHMVNLSVLDVIESGIIPSNIRGIREELCHFRDHLEKIDDQRELKATRCNP